MTIIVEVTTTQPGKVLERLLHTPLGLDIWEAKRERLVVRASEAQIDRIEKMGYSVRQIETVQRHVSTFSALAAPSGRDPDGRRPIAGVWRRRDWPTAPGS